jgi:hypothetical protein
MGRTIVVWTATERAKFLVAFGQVIVENKVKGRQAVAELAQARALPVFRWRPYQSSLSHSMPTFFKEVRQVVGTSIAPVDLDVLIHEAKHYRKPAVRKKKRKRGRPKITGIDLLSNF